MMRFVKAAPAVLLVLGLATTAPSTAAGVHQEEAYIQLSAAEKVSSRVERTKAWLKAKKNQTTRWVGRQKQKIKRAID